MGEPHEGHSHVSQGHAEEQTSNTSGPTSCHDTITEQENQQKRLSAYSFSNLPEVVPPATYNALQVVPTETLQGLHPVPAETYQGLQPVPADAYQRRVAQDYPKETATGPVVQVEHLPNYYSSEYGREAVSFTAEPPISEKPQAVKGWLNRRIYGVRARWILLGAALLIVLIIALGAGLGAGLKSNNSKSQKGSQSGALNGTRIALATQTFAGDSEESLVMYFQHYTGQIRWMKFADGEWTGGDASTVFANNAKKNTPISAVSYVWKGVSFWRVFYVDNTNMIREVWAGNNTQGWALGPLSNMNVSPLDDDQIGMVVCWDGPTAPQEYAEGYAETANSSQMVFRLVYASDETTFQQLAYHGDTQLWTPEQTLPNLNGHASPGCYSRGQGTVDYMMALDLQNQINVYWRDTNTNLTNTTTHPINVWTNASIAIPNVANAATLGYTKYLYSQNMNDKLITAYNLTFAAENTTLNTGSGFVVQGNPGLPNTGLAVTARPNSRGGDDVIAVYQTDGSHIGYYERDADGVSWNSANLVIPIN